VFKLTSGILDLDFHIAFQLQCNSVLDFVMKNTTIPALKNISSQGYSNMSLW